MAVERIIYVQSHQTAITMGAAKAVSYTHLSARVLNRVSSRCFMPL